MAGGKGPRAFVSVGPDTEPVHIIHVQPNGASLPTTRGHHGAEYARDLIIGAGDEPVPPTVAG